MIIPEVWITRDAMKTASLEAALGRPPDNLAGDPDLQVQRVPACLGNSGRFPHLLVGGKRLLLGRVGRSLPRPTEFDLAFVKEERHLVSVDASLRNRPIAEAVSTGQLRRLRGYGPEPEEVSFENSHLDLPLNRCRQRFTLEVRSLSCVEGNAASFPDSGATAGK